MQDSYRTKKVSAANSLSAMKNLEEILPNDSTQLLAFKNRLRDLEDRIIQIEKFLEEETMEDSEMDSDWEPIPLKKTKTTRNLNFEKSENKKTF